MINSRAKGARGERMWRDQLRAEGYTAKRGQQHAGGQDSPDVVCEEMKFHHRTHAELVQTQCKLLDMEMKCDQLQDEIKRLKIILDLIKKDVS